jgi:putative transposase
MKFPEMANTYTQLHIHSIFAVENRASLMLKNWETRLYEYISGIIRNNNHKPLIVNGMPDHIHAVFGMHPNQSVSDLMEIVKSCSSKWINDKHLTTGKFNWQKGFGAFACNKSQLPVLIDYVENQKIHHQSKSFHSEYLDILNKLGIDYNSAYLFHDPNTR